MDALQSSVLDMLLPGLGSLVSSAGGALGNLFGGNQQATDPVGATQQRVQQTQQQQPWQSSTGQVNPFSAMSLDPIGYNNMMQNVLGQMGMANAGNQQAAMYQNYLEAPLIQTQLQGQNAMNLAQLNNPWQFASTLGNQIGPTNSAAYGAYGNIGTEQVRQSGANQRLGAVLPMLQGMAGGMFTGGLPQLRGFEATNSNQRASF